MECQCALSKINAERWAQMVWRANERTAGDQKEMDERWTNEEKLERETGITACALQRKANRQTTSGIGG